MIEWTEQATRQLDQAHDYSALSNSEDVADRIVLQIVNSVQQLPAFPLSGRAGRVPGTRELVIPNTPFIAAYVIGNARIVGWRCTTGRRGGRIRFRALGLSLAKDCRPYSLREERTPWSEWLYSAAR